MTIFLKIKDPSAVWVLSMLPHFLQIMFIPHPVSMEVEPRERYGTNIANNTCQQYQNHCLAILHKTVPKVNPYMNISNLFHERRSSILFKGIAGPIIN